MKEIFKARLFCQETPQRKETRQHEGRTVKILLGFLTHCNQNLTDQKHNINNAHNNSF